MIVVDDGNPEPIATKIAALACKEIVVVRHPNNLGKGRAIASGLAKAADFGFTHALQMDADGQHNLGDVERFIETAKHNPDSLILGAPVFDSSAPRARVWGRKLSVWMVWLETGSRKIADPLCGYRVYPVAATLTVCHSIPIGARMDFDPEIAVRMSWSGVPMVNVSTLVVYSRDEASNFDYLKDNLRMILLHVRLVWERLTRRSDRAFREA